MKSSGSYLKIPPVAIGLLLLCLGRANAVPLLQLDIADGWYDPVSETIKSGGDTFTLYALLTPEGKAGDDFDAYVASLLADTYYISAALTPQVTSATDLGSFAIDGVHYQTKTDLVFGGPPFDQDPLFDAGDLSKHGIFETNHTQVAFAFDADLRAATYNAAENPGGLLSAVDGGTFYVPFVVNTVGLAPGYELHFDLYNIGVGMGGDIDCGDFAPFSHDAESFGTPTPEAATMFLFGTGLIGISLSLRPQKGR